VRSLLPGPWGLGNRFNSVGSKVRQPRHLRISRGMGRPNHRGVSPARTVYCTSADAQVRLQPVHLVLGLPKKRFEGIQIDHLESLQQFHPATLLSGLIVDPAANVTFISGSMPIYSCDLLLNIAMDSIGTNRKVLVSEKRRQPQLPMAYSKPVIRMVGDPRRSVSFHSCLSANQKGCSRCAPFQFLP